MRFAALTFESHDDEREEQDMTDEEADKAQDSQFKIAMLEKSLENARKMVAQLDGDLARRPCQNNRCINLIKANDRSTKLAAWLKWCLENCDDSAEWNFGTTATMHMKNLLAGNDAPMPPEGER